MAEAVWQTSVPPRRGRLSSRSSQARSWPPGLFENDFCLVHLAPVQAQLQVFPIVAAESRRLRCIALVEMDFGSWSAQPYCAPAQPMANSPAASDPYRIWGPWAVCLSLYGHLIPSPVFFYIYFLIWYNSPRWVWSMWFDSLTSFISSSLKCAVWWVLMVSAVSSLTRGISIPTLTPIHSVCYYQKWSVIGLTTFLVHGLRREYLVKNHSPFRIYWIHTFQKGRLCMYKHVSTEVNIK